MAAKAVIRDVGRVLGPSLWLRGSYFENDSPDPGTTFKLRLLRLKPQLQTAYDPDEEVKALIDMARVEGKSRVCVGKHAGGVVISPSLITDFAPLYCDNEGLHPVTHFDKNDVEYAGLVKFDFS